MFVVLGFFFLGWSVLLTSCTYVHKWYQKAGNEHRPLELGQETALVAQRSDYLVFHMLQVELPHFRISKK